MAHDIAVDEAGNVFVSWVTDHDDIVVRLWSAATETWSAPRRFALGVSPTYTELVLNDDGTPHLFARIEDGLYEVEGREVKYYFANGQRIATRVSSSDGLTGTAVITASEVVTGRVYYFLSDHLGSTTVVADAAGNPVGHVLYTPYGEILIGALPLTVTDRLFTGQRWDATIGLYDYNARFYDPQLGQFTQPDSLIPEPGNPIAWNRYAYVYNNPVNYTDSTGHFIDTLWDLADTVSDAGACLGGDALACYMLPLDVFFLAAPGVPGVADNVVRHADDVGDVIKYAPRSSGHHRRLQRAIMEGLEEGEVVAFRDMPWGWGTWSRQGYDIPFKPHAATWTWDKGPNGLRLTNAGVFLSDLDASWALDRGGRMIQDKDFMAEGGIARAINRVYGKDVVLHGTHWQGMIHDIECAVAGANGKNYLQATVYVYGKNINGVTGFLESGPGLDMYKKYRRLLHP